MGEKKYGKRLVGVILIENKNRRHLTAVQRGTDEKQMKNVTFSPLELALRGKNPEIQRQHQWSIKYTILSSGNFFKIKPKKLTTTDEKNEKKKISIKLWNFVKRTRKKVGCMKWENGNLLKAHMHWCYVQSKTDVSSAPHAKTHRLLPNGGNLCFKSIPWIKINQK